MSKRYLPTFSRNLLLLLAAQALAGSTSAVAFLVSGFIGTHMAPEKSLATLPMSVFIVGVALTSGVAAWLMSKLGRRAAHMIGVSVAMFGATIAMVGLSIGSFWIYVTSSLLLGVGTAFTYQIRFTAAELVPAEEKALAHSWVLMSSLFAALIGPAAASFGRHLHVGTEYLGSYVILLGILGIAFLALAFLKTIPQAVPTEANSQAASSWRIITNGKFVLAALVGLTGFAVMTLLMSATPIQMTDVRHFHHSDAIFTIQSHIIAMFLPSLFGGFLVARLGLLRLVLFGLSLFMICAVVGYRAGSLMEYWWALVLLGVGWNFLYLAGSTALSLGFSGREKFTAQGLNDTLVFGAQTLASLAAGWLLFNVGWTTLVISTVPLLLITAAVAIAYRRNLG
jgi:MFS family permease